MKNIIVFNNSRNQDQIKEILIDWKSNQLSCFQVFMGKILRKYSVWFYVNAWLGKFSSRTRGYCTQHSLASKVKREKVFFIFFSFSFKEKWSLFMNLFCFLQFQIFIFLIRYFVFRTLVSLKTDTIHYILQTSIITLRKL